MRNRLVKLSIGCSTVDIHTYIHTVQYSTVQYSTVQYSTVQYSRVQYSTVQYSTLHYITLHYITFGHRCIRKLFGLDSETCIRKLSGWIRKLFRVDSETFRLDSETFPVVFGNFCIRATGIR